MNTYLLEAKYELLSLVRTPRYSVSTIAFPSIFYIFFGIIMNQGNSTPARAVYTMTAMACMGVMMAAIWGLAAGIAAERGFGWLQVKRASPMPPFSYFLAKLTGALVFCTITVAVIFLLGGFFGGVHLAPVQWLSLAVFLVAGCLPFAALGFLIGYSATPNSAPAIVNLVVLPMSFLSGLWVPLMFLPPYVRQISNAMPAYHLHQLAMSVTGVGTQGTAPQHVEGMAAALMVFGGLAWIAWRRDDRKVFG